MLYDGPCQSFWLVIYLKIGLMDCRRTVSAQQLIWVCGITIYGNQQLILIAALVLVPSLESFVFAPKRALLHRMPIEQLRAALIVIAWQSV